MPRVCRKKAKMTYFSGAREEEDWHPQVQATQGRQHLVCQLHLALIKDWLASLAVAGGRARQKPTAPRLASPDGRSEGRRGVRVRGPRALSMVLRNGLFGGIQAN